MTGPVVGPEDADRYDAALRGWAVHLAEGGTTSWAEWTSAPVAASGAAREAGSAGSRRIRPGTVQLELLRRINLRDPDVGAAVADRVLHRPAPGRGPTAGPRSPSALTAGELLRVGAGVLADLVRELPAVTSTGAVAWEDDAHPTPASPASGSPAPGSPARVARGTWRMLRRRPSFVIAGPPRTAARLSSGLTAVGLVEHRSFPAWRGGGPTAPDLVVVPLLPLEELLLEAWEERARRGSPRGWRRFVRDWQGRAALPPGIDLPAQASRWADRVGPANVHLLGPDRLDEQVRDLLGQAPASCPPTRLAPTLVDVLRRYHAVQNLHLPAGRRPERTALLTEVLGRAEVADHAGSEPLGVPAGSRRWVQETGTRMAADLARYAGPADPAVLARTPPGRPGRLDHRRVLPVLTEVIVAVAARGQEGRR